MQWQAKRAAMEMGLTGSGHVSVRGKPEIRDGERTFGFPLFLARR
jgi:hypothetical protein